MDGEGCGGGVNPVYDRQKSLACPPAFQVITVSVVNCHHS